jgi:uncharacterized repeat protein (TIGR01451 family)
MFPRRALFTILAALAVWPAGAPAAMAAGTASGSQIDNYATVDYQVNSIAQTTVSSDTASFVVDNKIDVTVTTLDGSAVSVVPGSSDRYLSFSVTNDGNTVQDFSLSAAAATGTVFGVTDNFDADSVAVFVDANGNGSYDPGTDTATFIDELEPDSTATVFIVGDIPLARVNGDGALYDLVAQTAAGGAAGQGADITSDDGAEADSAMVVQTVFCDTTGTATGDAARDGKHSSRSAYEVSTADLTVTKTSVVVSDPVNGSTNPKAVPGATMRYTITVTNDGDEDASTVTIVDAIPANTAYVDDSLELDGGALTDDTAADDEGDYNLSNAGAVTVVVPTVVQGGGSAEVVFEVIIQ